MTRTPTPSGMRMQALEDSNYQCIYCGSPATVVDHIIPYAYVQTHTLDNLVGCCAVCNGIASDKHFDTFIEKMMFVQGVRRKRGLEQTGGITPEATRDKKVTSLSSKEIKGTLRKLDLLKTQKTYKELAQSLGVTYSYVHQISKRKMPPSAPFAKAVMELHSVTVFPKKPKETLPPKEIKRARDLLNSAVDLKLKRLPNLNQACIAIAKKLNYDPGYIFDMYKGKPLTDRAAKRIIKALTPKRKRLRLWTEFYTLEDYNKARALDGDERRRRLLE